MAVDLISPLVLAFLALASAVGLVLRALLPAGTWSWRLFWLGCLVLPAVALALLMTGERGSSGAPVHLLCTTEKQLESLPAYALYLPDLGRVLMMVGYLLAFMGALNLICGRVVVIEDEMSADVRTTLLRRSGSLFTTGCVFVLGGFLCGSLVGMPLLLPALDFGLVLAAMPVLASVGVGLSRYLKFHLFIEGLWRPAFWKTWGCFCFGLGIFLMTVCLSLVRAGGLDPGCVNLMDMLTRMFS